VTNDQCDIIVVFKRDLIITLHRYNNCTTPFHMGWGPVCEARVLILVQHQYNNCTTTPHMRVGPSMWDSPSCEGLLYSCCIGVVNLTFSVKLTPCEEVLCNCCVSFYLFKTKRKKPTID
jgi:hypothetical protein